MALGLYLLVALVAATVLAARPAHADTTFTVNSTGDEADAKLTDAFCDAIKDTPRAQCTLRAAIQEANDTPGADTINFDIPGTGVQTISVGAVTLPQITEAVTIDGYTQPGASQNTLTKGTNAVLMIELDGTNAEGIGATENGLEIIDAGQVVVKGLVINRFEGSGIFIHGQATHKIEGNFIGTDPSGTVDLGNGRGVNLNDAQGDTLVGGAAPAARNLISGNSTGVFFEAGSEGHEVRGNLIGTKKDGTSALGNSDGVAVLFGSSSTVTANTIAFNQEDGVTLRNSVRNIGYSILSNSIFSNGDLGIDLSDDGPTPNDFRDFDTGPNHLQNKPVISSATTSGISITVEGRLNSTPGKTFLVQFFSNPPGTDEGMRFLGQKNVTTGRGGFASFTFRPFQRVAVGQTITATATDRQGNTSEFSAPRTVVAQ